MTERNDPSFHFPKGAQFDSHDASGRSYPLVLVEWLDSCYDPKWHLDEPTTDPTRCRSVGWLIHDGEAGKVISSHVGDEEPGSLQRNGEMTIPTSAITSRHRIR